MISSLTRRTKDDIVSAMKKTNRLKKRRILTVKEFRARFGDDDQCARYLASERWPNGFRCPRCGGRSRGYMASRRSEEHTSELQSRGHLVCRLLLEKKKK